MAVIWLTLLLLCFKTHRLHASKELCSSEAFQNFPFSEENLCIEMDTLPSFNLSGRYEPKPQDIKMTLVKEDAVVEVRFPLANSHEFDRYLLLLKVIEAIGNRCPEDADFFQTMEIHSRYTFEVFECSDLKGLRMEDCSPHCNRMGVVRFKYIFTGCYQVAVTPAMQKIQFTKGMSEGPQYFETNYVKYSIEDLPPFIVPHCTDDGVDSDGQQHYQVEGYFRRNSTLADLPVTMELMENVDLSLGQQACSTSGLRHSCCTYNPLTGGEFTCHHKNVKVPTFCEIRNGTDFECTFKNISLGNHCVTFLLHDEVRCPGFTVWNNGTEDSCLFSEPTTCKKRASKESYTKEAPSGMDSILISIAAVVTVCCIGGIIYFIFHRRKLRTKNVDSGPYLVATPIQKSHPRVLLLYAQDCKEFMKLMQTFRSVLSNVCECEVLDCFDPDREGEVADNPVAWIRSNTSSPEMKVVVVASECAMRHQVALESRTELGYLNPLPRCHLFQYGLQEVSNNPKRQYTNTFVVRFDGTDLKYITQFTRYKLPLMLKDLLSSINPGLDLSNMEKFRDVQRLQENCEELIRYKQEYPEYFMKLIVKLEDAVVE